MYILLIQNPVKIENNLFTKTKDTFSLIRISRDYKSKIHTYKGIRNTSFNRYNSRKKCVIYQFTLKGNWGGF